MSHRSSVFEQLRFDCRMLTENGHLRQLSFYMYFSMVVLYTFRTKDDDNPGQCEEAGLILRFPHVLLLSVHSLFIFVLTCLSCLFCLQIPRKWSDFSLGEAKHTKSWKNISINLSDCACSASWFGLSLFAYITRVRVKCFALYIVLAFF